MLPLFAGAQPCSSIPGMNPSTAIPVCGATTFTQTAVPSCSAVVLPSSACIGNIPSSNAFWYKFHCFQTGSLGFIITPAAPSENYDWELFDVTGHQPDDVYSGDNLRISLNLSQQTGATGCTPDGIANTNCATGGPGSQFNLMPGIFAGKDYLLMIRNASGTGSGYNIIFVDGNAVITNTIPPAVDHLEFGCTNNAIKLLFTDLVACNSVTASGSEFTIMPGNIPAQSVNSFCAAGFSYINDLTIQLQNPLPPGNYSLVINQGTDGNTFKDVCGNQLLPGTSVPFTISGPVSGAVSNISFSGCAPTSLKVTLNKYVNCSSITNTGSEFTIQPGNPAITAVQQTGCTAGIPFTNTITILLQNPLPYGSYQLQLHSGADGDTFMDTCGILMPAAFYPFVINQQPSPGIQKVDFNECHPDRLQVNFDKAIACNTVAADASDFIINPGNIAVSGVSVNCNGGVANSLFLFLGSPLPAGNFVLQVKSGSDGNTIGDTCFSFISTGYNKPFITTQATRPVFDSVIYSKCSPSMLRVYYSKPIQCGSISSDGSDYFFTGPSPLTISSVATEAGCAAGFTHWVELYFTQPVSVAGNYTLHNKLGNDGDGIRDTCVAYQDPNETFGLTVNPTASAVFSYTVNWGCLNDTIVLSHPGGNGIVSWDWLFSDNTTASGPQVNHLFPVSVPGTIVQLKVFNGSCTSTSSVNIQLNNVFKAIPVLLSADTVCTGGQVSFDNQSVGTNLSYTWLFGDNSSFTGAVPPAHTYVNAGAYITQLVAADIHGCYDTGQLHVQAMPLPAVDFIGLNNHYCSGEVVSLNALLQGNFDTYTWDNGDGKTFVNKPRVNFTYPAENSYTVTLSASDHYCGLVQKSRQVLVYGRPVVSLGNDTSLCPGSVISIGISGGNPYGLLWNTGAITAQINTLPFTMLYKLSADNHGCVGTDSILVTIRRSCLIKVPNAFTPNDDGLNDQLRAINADYDLTKKFSFSIYSRFGQKIFSTTDPLRGWDGTYQRVPAEAAAYVWELNYTDRLTGKVIYEKGSSLLIR